MTNSIDLIKRRGKLRVGVAADLPGKSYLNPQTNQMEGFEVDLARMITKEIFGNEDNVEFIKVLGKERQNSIVQDRVDLVISLFTITRERLEHVAFSKPYYIDTEALLVLKEGPIKSLSDLKGKKVAVIENSATLTSLEEEFPEAEAVPVKSKSDAIQDIREHRVAALINTYVNLSLMLPTLKDAASFSLLDTGDQFPIKEYAVGIKKDRQDLVKFVSDAISKFEANGTLKKKLKEHGWSRETS